MKKKKKRNTRLKFKHDEKYGVCEGHLTFDFQG